MPSSQLEQFLTEILEVEGGIGLEKVKAMETAYQLSIAKNNEIKFRQGKFNDQFRIGWMD